MSMIDRCDLDCENYMDCVFCLTYGAHTEEQMIRLVILTNEHFGNDAVWREQENLLRQAESEIQFEDEEVQDEMKMTAQVRFNTVRTLSWQIEKAEDTEHVFSDDEEIPQGYVLIQPGPERRRP